MPPTLVIELFLILHGILLSYRSKIIMNNIVVKNVIEILSTNAFIVHFYK